MSIRLRLTLLYSMILALTLMVFSAVLYATQSRYTLNTLTDDLSRDADRIAGTLARAVSGPDRRPIPWIPWWNNAEDRRSQAMQPLELGTLRVRDTFRLLSVDGTPVELPGNQDGEDLSLSKKGLAQLQSGLPWIEIAPGEEGRLLIYSQPVTIGGETVAIVQLARTLVDRDRSLRALGVALIMGSLLTTFVAFGVGWALAGVTLRPVHRITQTALEIGRTRDFSSRVYYEGPNDELGQLATTFNDMLSHLQDAYQQVAHALQMQREFVADVSHELRTPLTTIRGNLALLRRRPPPPPTDREDILDDLMSESERLIRLVSDLLTLARADAGRKLTCDPVPVKPLLEDACRQARLLEPGRQIVCEGSDDAVALANCDALKQVLLILFDNAVKHTDGPIQAALGDYNGEISISVKDSGPGMSPGLCERIFDRFYQGDASRSTPGFGLGLSIAKALAEAQGGTVGVESEVGTGSTFTVIVPRAADP